MRPGRRCASRGTPRPLRVDCASPAARAERQPCRAGWPRSGSECFEDAVRRRPDRPRRRCRDFLASTSPSAESTGYTREDLLDFRLGALRTGRARPSNMAWPECGRRRRSPTGERCAFRRISEAAVVPLRRVTVHVVGVARGEPALAVAQFMDIQPARACRASACSSPISRRWRASPTEVEEFIADVGQRYALRSTGSSGSGGTAPDPARQMIGAASPAFAAPAGR